MRFLLTRLIGEEQPFLNFSAFRPFWGYNRVIEQEPVKWYQLSFSLLRLIEKPFNAPLNWLSFACNENVQWSIDICDQKLAVDKGLLHVSQSYINVGRTMQLYTKFLVGKWMSVQHQWWHKFPCMAWAFEILGLLSPLAFSFALMHLPKWVNLCTKSNFSSLCCKRCLSSQHCFRLMFRELFLSLLAAAVRPFKVVRASNKSNKQTLFSAYPKSQTFPFSKTLISQILLWFIEDIVKDGFEKLGWMGTNP